MFFQLVLFFQKTKSENGNTTKPNWKIVIFIQILVQDLTKVK